VKVLYAYTACSLLATMLTGCGYTFMAGSGPYKQATLSVPYVVGDQDGSLTSAIVREVVREGTFRYRSCDGALTLKVTQIDQEEENIGFRYDRKKKGALTKDTIPTETRITSIVEITLVENGSGATLLGPVQLSASVDYDHDFYFSRNGVNIFSLGQLTDLDTAYDAVQTPLNQAIARKIVAYIANLGR